MTPSGSRKPLALVLIVMTTLALAIAAVLELGGMRSPEVADAGAVPFVLAALAGALAGWIATFGAGILGGSLTGFAYALGGGIVQVFSPGSSMPLSAVLTTVFLMTVLGAALGALGALPFGLSRWRHDQKRMRQR